MPKVIHARPYSLMGMFLLAATALMAFVGWTLDGTLRAAHAASQHVQHSNDVLRTVGTFRESFATIAAAQRGFLLAGGPRFLQEREQAIARGQEAVNRLRWLTRDNPDIQAQVARLGDVMAERVADVRALTAQLREPVLPLPLTAQQVERVRQTAEEGGRLARQIEAEELRLLSQRQLVELERQKQTSVAVAASFAAFATVLLLALGGVVFESRRRSTARRQLQEIVDNLPVTVWQLRSNPHRKGRFVFVAEGARRDRGIDPAALLRDGELVTASVFEDDLPQLAEARRKSRETLVPMDCSYRVRVPGDAEPRWIHAHARLRRLPNGDLLWTGYWSDITKQKAMEQALRDATEAARGASRAKTTFLATMSHEIRTPMTGVLGLLELLGHTRLDREQRDTLGVIRESSRALLRLIDDILDFSKVEEGRLSLAPVPASLRDTVRRACDVHSGIASSRGLLLEQQVDPRVAAAHLFDPLRVGQILNNFISNAVKFTERGGVKVAVDLLDRREDGELVRVSVTDTGIGVPQDRIAQLFQPFEQGAPQIASTYGGTGLGLAICRRLGELMGGTVSMHSSEGQGTRVVLDVRLPVCDPADLANERLRTAGRRVHAAVKQRRSPPSPQAAEADGTLVLVVDDHPTNRMVLARQVASLGYGAVVADDGVAALAIWRSRQIGLVLTDSNMPGMNGHDLARTIRRIEAEDARKRVPILACTANAMEGESERCAAAGMDGCLIKPLELADLQEHLQQWLPLPVGAEAPAVRVEAHAQDSQYNAQMLSIISGGERDEERRILEAYLHANAEDLERLERAVNAHDTPEVARLAHRVMGAAQTLGARDLLRACRAMEENALVGEPQSTLIGDLQRILGCSADLERRLRHRLDRGEAPGSTLH